MSSLGCSFNEEVSAIWRTMVLAQCHSRGTGAECDSDSENGASHGQHGAPTLLQVVAEPFLLHVVAEHRGRLETTTSKGCM